MDILTEEYLTCKNKIMELQAMNEIENDPVMFSARNMKIKELQKACDWSLNSIGTIGLTDERSAIL